MQCSIPRFFLTTQNLLFPVKQQCRHCHEQAESDGQAASDEQRTQYFLTVCVKMTDIDHKVRIVVIWKNRDDPEAGCLSHVVLTCVA